ncbi:MAG: hypothetical protein N4A38_04430 [Candidatus Gracilibacteria bacterium]|nr:hypothetical protein [Candidatus Gracilibacteria bacterium]
MSVEEIGDIEEVESGSQGVEVSEKDRQRQEKAKKQFKKLQKDENKAKKTDLLLADFLSQILKDRRYDFLWDDIIDNIDEGVPSNFILGVLSLIYLPISDKIREFTLKEKIVFDYSTEERIKFDDNKLDDKIKLRINQMLEDIIGVVTYEPSTVLTQRLIKQIKQKQVVKFFQKTFLFFFDNINIDISDKKALSYSMFILDEIRKTLEKIELEEI